KHTVGVIGAPVEPLQHPTAEHVVMVGRLDDVGNAGVRAGAYVVNGAVDFGAHVVTPRLRLGRLNEGVKLVMVVDGVRVQQVRPYDVLRAQRLDKASFPERRTVNQGVREVHMGVTLRQRLRARGFHHLAVGLVHDAAHTVRNGVVRLAVVQLTHVELGAIKLHNHSAKAVVEFANFTGAAGRVVGHGADTGSGENLGHTVVGCWHRTEL